MPCLLLPADTEAGRSPWGCQSSPNPGTADTCLLGSPWVAGHKRKPGAGAQRLPASDGAQQLTQTQGRGPSILPGGVEVAVHARPTQGAPAVALKEGTPQQRSPAPERAGEGSRELSTRLAESPHLLCADTPSRCFREARLVRVDFLAQSLPPRPPSPPLPHSSPPHLLIDQLSPPLGESFPKCSLSATSHFLSRSVPCFSSCPCHPHHASPACQRKSPLLLI